MILLLDANEDMKNGNLARSIRSEPKLKIKDLVMERERKEGPDTWFRVTKQIEGAFATPNVDCCGSRVLPFWFSMGGHKAIVVDIPYQSLLVEQVLKVVRPQAKRLQYGLTGPKHRYLQKFKTLFQ